MRSPEKKTSPTRRPASQHTSKVHGHASRRQPTGDGGASPDEPDEGEFEIIGDNDLGAADLGPLGPNADDPDTDSGRIRKITRGSGRGSEKRQ